MNGGSVESAGWRGFGGRHPLFVAALAAVVCVVLADVDGRLGFGAAACLTLLGFRDGNWRRGLAVALVCGVVVAVFCRRNAVRDVTEEDLLKLGSGKGVGRVLETAWGTGGHWSAPVKLTAGEFAGAKVLWEGAGEPPVAGSVAVGTGDFAPLPVRRNPGEFDEGGWWRRKGVAVVFRASAWSSTTETGRRAELGAKVKRAFRDAITTGLDEESEEARVIRAVVVGEQPRDSDALVEAFRNSGTLHIFSVSGMHVSMMGSIGWLCLRLGRVPRRWAVAGLIPLIFGYAWITGNQPPAARAAWMLAVFLMAFVFKRRPDLLNALGAVMLAMLLWDGNLLFQAGVQLSYGVVAVIALGSALAGRAFSWMAAEENYLPWDLVGPWRRSWLWLRRGAAQSFAVSTAAWAGSTPLTVWHFGLVTPVSILANLPLLVEVYVMMVLALLGALLAPFLPAGARWVNRVNGGIAVASVRTAASFSALPGGHFQVRKTMEPQLVVFDLKYGAGASCFAGGQGGGAVLMDCGDRNSFKYGVMPSLRRLGISPDSVVLSHPDGGHIADGPLVWSAFPIRQVLLPVERARSASYRTWLRAGEEGIQVRQAGKTERVPFPDGAWLEVMAPPEARSQNVIADDRVMVSRLHWRGWRILFMSDAGVATERRLLDSGRELAAEVIVVGRHRRDQNLHDAFLDAVGPKVIVAGNAAFPVEERLPERQVEYWRSRGIEVVDQGRTGGVTLKVDGDGALGIAGFVDESRLRITR